MLGSKGSGGGRVRESWRCAGRVHLIWETRLPGTLSVRRMARRDLRAEVGVDVTDVRALLVREPRRGG